jgi:phospholipid N-methyltransferase
VYKNLPERLIFLLRSLTGKVGAISISSHYIINKVMALIHGPLNNVVEYGAGTGVMTNALLQKLSPAGKLIVIESDSQFIKILKKIDDPRLHIIEGRIQDQFLDAAHGFSNIDLAVSSIPFSLLTPTQRQKIISDTKIMLTPEGSFILFHQYLWLAITPLKENFKKVSVFFEFRNIFPSFILQAEKIKKQDF